MRLGAVLGAAVLCIRPFPPANWLHASPSWPGISTRRITQWLTLIAEFDQRNGWSHAATQSCAHWLNWQCGIALGAAREKVRVAHALEALPLISASMARGDLSYSKVRALTRVADANTAATRWRGERIDYGLAIDALLQRANRARDVSAGTSP